MRAIMCISHQALISALVSSKRIHKEPKQAREGCQAQFSQHDHAVFINWFACVFWTFLFSVTCLISGLNNQLLLIPKFVFMFVWKWIYLMFVCYNTLMNCKWIRGAIEEQSNALKSMLPHSLGVCVWFLPVLTLQTFWVGLCICLMPMWTKYSINTKHTNMGQMKKCQKQRRVCVWVWV